ncbi:hypothetical protein [Actinomycetospora lemnae]|uniref:Uncharacterized protein n=1 Tax=Actinomycetospora lemnae TaxID=3019891 RepID=A0ABT5SYG2_9PSEU|nr:hypothetical protein [Actinomycetospora sp. DW7H6]MDD7966753.1 hypothetical protein [Actinomycetospora sp. DW7H6]
MGQHSARRPGAMSSVAGRGLFTATAAFALLGGGAGMAFAGEATHGPSHGGSHGESQEGHSSEGGSCEVPVVDPTLETGEGAINEATGDATAPLFEAGTEATAPVHDIVCPPASELLGPVLGGGSQDAEEQGAEDEGAATDAEATDDEGAEEDTGEGTAATEGAATEGAATQGAASQEQLPPLPLTPQA